MQHITNKEIIKLVKNICNNKCLFDKENFFPYPNHDVEELDILHFKVLDKLLEKNKLIMDIKNISINDIENVEFIIYQNYGLFICIVLMKYYNRIINRYNQYQDYRNINAEKINRVYCFLNKQIPEEFVGWILFNQNKN